MAVENLKGSLVVTDLTAVPQKFVGVNLNGGRVRCSIDTVEVSAAASATSTYHLARIPSNATILPSSKLHIDALADTLTPTLDIGIYAVDSNLVNADDADALNDGIDAKTAGSYDVIKDVATAGIPAWDFVASETKDPGGLLDIKVAILDAACNTGGSITLELFYTID